MYVHLGGIYSVSLKTWQYTFAIITLENLDDFNDFYTYLETGMNSLRK